MERFLQVCSSVKPNTSSTGAPLCRHCTSDITSQSASCGQGNQCFWLGMCNEQYPGYFSFIEESSIVFVIDKVKYLKLIAIFLIVNVEVMCSFVFISVFI